jgi:hypothetical protein
MIKIKRNKEKIEDLLSKINNLQKELDKIKTELYPTMEDTYLSILKEYDITDISWVPKEWDEGFIKRRGIIATITGIKK